MKVIEDAMTIMAKAQLNKDLSAAEIAAIVVFLEPLTGAFPEKNIPRLPATPVELLE